MDVRQGLIMRSITLLLFCLYQYSIYAESPDIVVAMPGQNVTLFKGWNVSGDLYLKIDGGKSEDCLKAWMIVMGTNIDIGKICDKGKISYTWPLIYGEIRAGGFTRQTAISISSNSKVAYSHELCDHIIKC